MHIDHIGIWTRDLERLKIFYTSHFKCTASEKYENKQKQFASYFLKFQNGPSIELMSRTDITDSNFGEKLGLGHFALGVGDVDDVNYKTQILKDAGVVIHSNPRYTGDGCYESIVLDPDGNRIELIASELVTFSRSNFTDLNTILRLQKCCYLSEAEIYNNYNIPPLTQTLESLQNEFSELVIFKLECQGNIIGSVRASLQNETCCIGRLVVEPNYQNRGYGTLMLRKIESEFSHVKRFELFTGKLSTKNLNLYKTLGYNTFKEIHEHGLMLVYLEKFSNQNNVPLKL